ncbi:MAG TPA: hypothetical protein VK973_10870 [Arenicellales bacterium]|nr:hypothetical protein [Arenicellales bacterium]
METLITALAAGDPALGREDVDISLHGQGLNPESYAICKANMLIKGQPIHDIKLVQVRDPDVKIVGRGGLLRAERSRRLHLWQCRQYFFHCPALRSYNSTASTPARSRGS